MSEEIRNNDMSPVDDEVMVSHDTVRYLTFISDGLEIGVTTNHVVEIITGQTITFMPMLPPYVKGIINLRGRLVPIIDIRVRMGKMPAEKDAKSYIIVLNINSVAIGITVDDVRQVLDIDETKIVPVPTENRSELITGMTTINGDNVLLFLDCKQMIDSY